MSSCCTAATTTTSAKASTRVLPAQCGWRWSLTRARAGRSPAQKVNWVAELLALVDYGAGHLHSVHNALRFVGAKVCVTDDLEFVRTSVRIVARKRVA